MNNQEGGEKSSSAATTVRLDSRPSVRTIPMSQADSDSNISNTSFKRWHRHMQSEHLRLKRPSFTLWKCCSVGCRPCRWFDSIEYDKKICKCCLTFKTFKTWGTILIMGIFFYIFTYSILKQEVLPGGTIFFLFFMFLTSYLCGYGLLLIGLPPMLGHIGLGIIFGNVPREMLPKRDDSVVEEIAGHSEKILLLLALIRAGLLLDMSQIKKHVSFIIRLATVPFICEFFTTWICSHFLLTLPWDWSALQGSVISVVSLASLTSIMTKNKNSGYGEDKDLCTVIIAAAVLNVVFGLCLYTIIISYIMPYDENYDSVLFISLFVLENVIAGVLVGGLCGLLVAFFPDKRNAEAAALRIMVLGIGSFAIANAFNEFHMPEAGALGCLTLCITAANMWEELGWHRDNNPVQYFYTMAYYCGQPVVLSLVGFTMDFHKSEQKEVGMAVAVISIGLLSRESICSAVSSSPSYPTTFKERIFICVAWFSKGTFQALLAVSIQYLVLNNKLLEEEIHESYLHYSKIIKLTTIISILLTTPLACFILTMLSPVLLKKPEISDSESFEPSGRRQSFKRRRSSYFEHARRISMTE